MSSDVSPTTQPGNRSVWPMFIAGLLMIGLFWGATELIRSWVATGSNTEAEAAVIRTKNLQELQASNQKELEGYSWADKEKGTVRIPIQRAMELEIAVLNERKPQPGTLIDPDAAAAEAAAKAPATAAPIVTPATPAPADAVAPVPPNPGVN